MEVLEIRGTRDAMFTMRLNMANCFPCSVTWLRKLLKKAIDVSDDPQLYRAELVLYMNDLLAEVTDPEKKASILQEFRDYKEAAEARGTQDPEGETGGAGHDEEDPALRVWPELCSD